MQFWFRWISRIQWRKDAWDKEMGLLRQIATFIGGWERAISGKFRIKVNANNMEFRTIVTE